MFAFVFNEGCGGGGVWVLGHDYPAWLGPSAGIRQGGRRRRQRQWWGERWWWERRRDVAAFEPRMPDLANCGLPIPNEQINKN